MQTNKTFGIRCFLCYLMLCPILELYAQTTIYKVQNDIFYQADTVTDNYAKEKCKLDLYYPTNIKNFPTIIWIHGGGMEGGNKSFPKELQQKGMAIVSINYRLSPKVNNPTYIQDVAAAVAWTFKHIKTYGGRANKIFVSGHSAGGYLTLMLATDKSYLAAYDIDADRVRAYFPISGQTVTHFTIRKERQLPYAIPIIDRFAPINNIRSIMSPVVLITGDRHLEMACRWEENAYLLAVAKQIDNHNMVQFELEGFNHNTVVAPACYLICNQIKDFCK